MEEVGTQFLLNEGFEWRLLSLHPTPFTLP